MTSTDTRKEYRNTSMIKIYTQNEVNSSSFGATTQEPDY